MQVLDPNRNEAARPGASVLVAMSGGVDSSVAAWLLREEGMRVEGLTLSLCPEPLAVEHPVWALRCLESVERARRVCRLLGVRHAIVEQADAFWERVVDPFCTEYAGGRTPNPCVLCNPRVKWAALLEEAGRRGCDFVATGHYARLARTGGRVQILRGLDRSKDQSYALYGLDQTALGRTLFPLGARRKSEVRKAATDLRLPVWDTAESQDVCFIPKRGHEDFLAARVALAPGPIEDSEGRLLGTHRGLALYTVGQRKGLGVAGGKPLYVLAKDAAANRLVVGPREALCRRCFLVSGVSWVSSEAPPDGSSLETEVELRYRARPVPAEIRVLAGGRVEVRLDRHTQAVAPGQSAVWYQGEVLIGGGIIEE
ncbi:MAG: tRNA 2-thiouridine(34) synthase MnmA [bacterium]